MIYYVGIDISKYKHDFCIISNTGEVIVENSSFENNKKGFQLFLDQLKPYNKQSVQIAFEATGHYSLNLELFLTNQDYSFMKVNPLVVHQFLKARSLRRTKTDKADSFTMASYLMSIQYKPNSYLLYNIYTLKSLCRSREQLIKERSKFEVLLTNELDKSFPELKPFFNNMISNTLLFILDKYKNIKHISLMKDYDSIRCVARGKFTYAKFAQLKELAKNSIGHHDENTDLLISTYVSIINNFNEKIDPINKQISTIIKDLNPRMLTIPGLGEISAAIILSVAYCCHISPRSDFGSTCNTSASGNATSAVAPCSSLGITTVKHVPFPYSLSTEMLPSCNSTNILAKFKPIPEPEAASSTL